VNYIKLKIVKQTPVRYKPVKITKAIDVYNLLKKEVKTLDREQMWCLVLNTGCYLMGVNLVGIGTVDSFATHPREILKPVILMNGSGFIVVHNHPSGDVSPSQQDLDFTEHIESCARVMSLKFMDHVIVSDTGFYSIKGEFKGGKEV